MPVRQRGLCRDQRGAPPGIRGMGGSRRASLAANLEAACQANPAPLASAASGAAADRQPSGRRLGAMGELAAGTLPLLCT